MDPQITDNKSGINSESSSQIQKKNRRKLLIYVLPKLFTTANLFCGFYAVIMSVHEKWSYAAWALIIASFADSIDGRVARMTNTQSAFGEQYDSMSDLISFGLAPSILMYLWSLQPYGRMGWVIAFLYLTCAALRLTRFNVLKQSAEKKYFQGLPSPVAAGTLASAVLFYQEIEASIWTGKSVFILIVTFCLAAAMISGIRYRSFKDVKFPSQQGFGILIIFILIFTIFSAAPEKVMFPIAALYFSAGVLSEFFRFMRRKFSWFPGKGRS